MTLRLRVLPAIPPTDGREIELQTTDTYIQWRYINPVGDADPWQDLVAVSELVGPEGPAIEMRSDGTNLQYRQIGASTWTDLVPLADLTGEPGQEGPIGPQGPSVSDGDKGDITVSSSGAAWSIDNGAITFEKLSTALATAIPTLAKASAGSPCITKTGAGTASVKAGTAVKVGTTQVRFASDTAITMPSLTAGTDYAVFVSSAGAAQAVAWTANTGTDPTPPVGTWTWIGGFHYLPGGVPAEGAQTGGTTTPAILAMSIWDLNYRPGCPDPRGKTKFAKDWMNIYRLGVDHILNGPSRNGVAEANHNGAARPKRPLRFGGNGTAVMTLDWFAANEIAQSHGQRLPTYDECCTAFYGVVEGISRGVAPVTTGFDLANPGTEPDEKFISWCGIMGATGCRWVWCSDNSYAYTGAPAEAYYDILDGRGKAAHDSATAWRKVLAGGKSNNAAGEAGSRAFDNANSPQTFSVAIGARFVADHLEII